MEEQLWSWQSLHYLLPIPASTTAKQRFLLGCIQWHAAAIPNIFMLDVRHALMAIYVYVQWVSWLAVADEPKSRHVHVHFQEGGKGVLHCPANGFPTELVKWKDPNGVDLDDTVNSTHPVYVTRNGALHIDVVTTSNEGVFTCIQFSYYFGRLENTVDVTVSGE